MTRRELIAFLGGAAALPLAARAQQPTMLVVGFLSSASPAPFAHLVAGFRRGLQDAGFVEDRNVVVEYRWAEGALRSAAGARRGPRSPPSGRDRHLGRRQSLACCQSGDHDKRVQCWQRPG